jgi:tetratricopeptide (TPR) repeat protein
MVAKREEVRMIPSPERRTSRTINRLVLLAFATALAGIAYWANDRMSRASRRAEAIELAKKGSPTETLDALSVLDSFLDSDPSDPELLEAAVVGSIRTGKPETVTEALTKRWFDSEPHRLAPAEARLRLLHSLNRPAPELIPVLERWLVLDPESLERRRELASMYYIVGRFDDALREARIVLQMPNSDRIATKTAIARAEFARGENAAAATELDAILESEPNRPDVLLLRAKVHQKLGEDRLAVAILQKLQPADPSERITVLNLLGQSLARLERPNEAKAAFDRLSRLQEAVHRMGDARQKSRDWEFQRRAAESLLNADLPREAAELLSDAILRIGVDRAALLLLADCHERLGDSLRAREARAEADRLR